MEGPSGLGFPGVGEEATIWPSANLPGKFSGCDGAKLFGKATGCPIAMSDDAAAAGIAAMHFGAGRGFMGKALLLTLGTGVGSYLADQGGRRITGLLDFCHAEQLGPGESGRRHYQSGQLLHRLWL